MTHSFLQLVTIKYGMKRKHTLVQNTKNSDGKRKFQTESRPRHFPQPRLAQNFTSTSEEPYQWLVLLSSAARASHSAIQGPTAAKVYVSLLEPVCCSSIASSLHRARLQEQSSLRHAVLMQKEERANQTMAFESFCSQWHHHFPTTLANTSHMAKPAYNGAGSSISQGQPSGRG